MGPAQMNQAPASRVDRPIHAVLLGPITKSPMHGRRQSHSLLPVQLLQEINSDRPWLAATLKASLGALV